MLMTLPCAFLAHHFFRSHGSFSSLLPSFVSVRHCSPSVCQTLFLSISRASPKLLSSQQHSAGCPIWAASLLPSRTRSPSPSVRASPLAAVLPRSPAASSAVVPSHFPVALLLLHHVSVALSLCYSPACLFWSFSTLFISPSRCFSSLCCLSPPSWLYCVFLVLFFVLRIFSFLAVLFFLVLLLFLWLVLLLLFLLFRVQRGLEV